ncbi:hypothetical protein AB4259_11900 [Vibrio amylolyticus]|uniref:hypothetical protein n=1 Tax=Vibrio amylolyticus TaxID=2847292 RepID=UPI00354C14E8
MAYPSPLSFTLYEFSQLKSDVYSSSELPQKQRDVFETYNDLIAVIQTQLKELLHLAGYIFIEYQIGKTQLKADAVVLYRGLVFVVVFRSGESAYRQVDIELAQQLAFALKEHHQPSHDKFIIPVVLSTHSAPQRSEIHVSPNGVFNTILDNGDNFAALLEHFANQFKADEIDSGEWES